MEDIRMYRIDDEERAETDENAFEWELARIDADDEVPFHIPRD